MTAPGDGHVPIPHGDTARRHRMIVSYDGAAFFGWQIQPQRRSVQGDLEEALSTLLREKVNVTGAGRTDSGVHSVGQVAHFDTTARFAPALLEGRLNGYLEADVSVCGLRRATAAFDARRSATGRLYRYHLAFRKSPLSRGRSWYTPGLDPAALREHTRGILGEHDFKAFCARGDRHENTLCVLRRADWKAWEGGLFLELEGNRFLHHMVRNLVGTLVPMARGAWHGPGIPELLAGRDRRLAGPTAPARGLCLVRVYYGARPGGPGPSSSGPPPAGPNE
ncbi:MAG: tRNA pseudouridine(38-40) synthase TruA [Candidatus Eisenbacteria bacterium]|nr:tRNA pseudouridine(38-40) synthase TruA [Candidatus Eisenbacteria bacterium]